MQRYILGGKEAKLPYEIEELDLRLYTAEELSYYIYHNLSLIGDDFIDGRLLAFLSSELGLPEEAEKIAKLYKSPSDQDATLLMLLSDIGYYTETELTEFKNRLVSRRRKNGPERMLQKADSLFECGRFMKAVRFYRVLIAAREDGRISAEMRVRVLESVADSYGMLYAFDEALYYLGKAYEESKNEKYLRKMYEVSVLSGAELPKKYFDSVPEQKLGKWQQEYWVRESTVKNTLQEKPIMEAFFKNKKEMETELTAFTDREKELYRRALE